MGDFQAPFTVSPPPFPSSPDKSNIPFLYYGLVLVGIAVIALALYNCIVMKQSRGRHMQSQTARPNGLVEVVIESNVENCQRNLLLSFKYKKEAGKEGGGEDYECPVCLSGFEEGEEVRKLPRCEHYFHAPCIDMWLYSHFDCPICRTPVGPFCHRVPPENSRH
ncbi:E3 ubiquitin-protein ligase RHA2B-like [Abrus precatorius]|uniref:E3 ubiquitin-protein ligase RHA2B-like n=1 Tax=Abrus precatorius TaxID=3816 RepID=A0A8B8MMB1_ABRPR|nr:E3 ubiquitin-protein ligase RHA2B-like [Abrus precatorius]